MKNTKYGKDRQNRKLEKLSVKGSLRNIRKIIQSKELLKKRSYSTVYQIFFIQNIYELEKSQLWTRTFIRKVVDEIIFC